MSWRSNIKLRFGRIENALMGICAMLALSLALTGAASARDDAPTHSAAETVGARVSGRTAAAAASVANEMSFEGGGVPFAIADFDGDQRPDLARVQAGQSNSFRTQYWIQLQLTQAREQLIGVVAPIGGLQLIASDVNGDHAIDLVLSTAWLNRPVAILLNDGYGRFTAMKPSAFPSAFRQAASERLSQRQRPRDAASATQSRAGVDAETKLAQSAPETRARRHTRLAIFLPASLLSHRGRAPPACS